MTARNAICRTSMSLLSNPVPRTDRKKSSNECSPTDSHIYDPGADDGIVLAQSGHREGVGCNFRARLVEKLANVRFSNRPFEVKHFQTIHHCSVDVAHWTDGCSPCAWLARQITEAFPWDTAPAYIVRDNDRAFGSVFRRRIQAMGIRDWPTSFRSPWQNGHVERLIGSIRRERTDHLIPGIKKTLAGKEA